MAESNITAVNLEDGQLYKETRNSWVGAGVDNFTQPPSQDPDMFMQFTNILPAVRKVLYRRYGYRTFAPQLDTGTTDGV